MLNYFLLPQTWRAHLYRSAYRFLHSLLRTSPSLAFVFFVFFYSEGEKQSFSFVWEIDDLGSRFFKNVAHPQAKLAHSYQSSFLVFAILMCEVFYYFQVTSFLSVHVWKSVDNFFSIKVVYSWRSVQVGTMDHGSCRFIEHYRVSVWRSTGLDALAFNRNTRGSVCVEDGTVDQKLDRHVDRKIIASAAYSLLRIIPIVDIVWRHRYLSGRYLLFIFLPTNKYYSQTSIYARTCIYRVQVEFVHYWLQFFRGFVWLSGLAATVCADVKL